MINIAICDDEKRVLDDLSVKIQKAFDQSGYALNLFSTDNSFVLLEYLKNNISDVLFLDIDMPKLGGMDIAQFLTDKNTETLLVFVTNHDALVYQSFLYHPFGFIRKSHFDEEIGIVSESIVRELQKKNEYFSFKTNEGYCRVLTSDILYLESKQNYINLHTFDKTFKFRSTIISVENELTVKGFIRIHKGFLVNGKHIFRVYGENIELDDKTLLPIGRTNRDNIKKMIMRYMR